MSDKPELKPCPFCGGEAEIKGSFQSPHYWIECSQCDVDCDWLGSLTECINNWNTRQTSSAG